MIRSVRFWGACLALVTLLATASTAHASNIVRTAERAGNFKTLVTALKLTGLDRTLRRGGHFTVFAPTDAAFARLPRGVLNDLLKPRNRGKLRRILLYHVLGQRVPSRKIRQGRTHARTLLGRSVTIRRHGRRIRVNGNRVVAADVRASNGVIHAINGVLLP